MSKKEFVGRKFFNAIFIITMFFNGGLIPTFILVNQLHLVNTIWAILLYLPIFYLLLQKLEGIGLVVPVGEEHMYFAAMNSKACELTAVGKQYWRLVKEGRI